MYHQMERSMEVMNSNTVFLTNLWKLERGGEVVGEGLFRAWFLP